MDHKIIFLFAITMLAILHSNCFSHVSAVDIIQSGGNGTPGHFIVVYPVVKDVYQTPVCIPMVHSYDCNSVWTQS